MEKTSKIKYGWLVTAMLVVLLVIDQIIKVYQDPFCLASLFVLLIGLYQFVENNSEWLGVCRLSASSG